ncbi:hypothetical protein DSCO28_30290 [Desulfosarcina ovata subsp. sediminis]|uniref:Uncharacterized protein n=1 Tax=Desulfosarcina ovata subsp. sediminis TaxID=885957 RepID=A0A5K7ZRQ7_9BACT|nr:hypothetical protein [Desulfosarcina ovata]BBO82463.1 hypothetical protein DSCO28_30290 [Desulfosarcina ovata subsp. sediminis]
MTKLLRNVIKGAGSIMDIAPRTDYRRFVSKESPSKRIARYWKETGRYIKHSMDAHEEKTTR